MTNMYFVAENFNYYNNLYERKFYFNAKKKIMLKNMSHCNIIERWAKQCMLNMKIIFLK